ncbi:hypothetical protein DESUT3_01470 [Desulfuromonas versatilis]|uniref:Restriction endonuclease n=1 Tax=Desulfuromonas versatilis TaxID=2802975 RepID=A0ABM8HNI5_9BACT|nr:hypothetical protein [Desulfuromonas versatilis]BCR03078.1 hypothetical protein DESUT3_01470 [Desulfuromonas versatilis]
MDKDELVELFKPTPTQREGRAQVDNAKVSAAYRELSSRTGIPEQCFDYRAVSEPNAVTRAPSESIGKRFYQTAGGNDINEWVFFARVGVEITSLEAIASSLRQKLVGACSLAILFATQQDWRVYKIFYAQGHRGKAEKIAEIFEVEGDALVELGPFISFRTAPQIPGGASVPDLSGAIRIPKPFMLLAGISGTGKTRFVREQAKLSSDAHGLKLGDNYRLIPVRPDWHEPSDLLGYISRIGQNGARYIVSDLLRFIVSAWKASAQSANEAGIVCKDPGEMCPFWLCLDEMNLAPVEQYFADYLSILETRNWTDGKYACEPLLKSSKILELCADGQKDLWKDLGIDGDDGLSVGFREYFVSENGGISLPPNLIIAGTVNMDETTHGFSRKVIDRALTIDFGEFYPNDYAEFYEPKFQPKPLSFPILSQVEKACLSGVEADPDGSKTIAFLSALNDVLSGTPFELAYRALNEALLSVVCFAPSGDEQLQAVWDDFLMMKVLPRIEGDREKLQDDGAQSLLTRLSETLEAQLPLVWNSERTDLLRETIAGEQSKLESCRSRKKIEWMREKLNNNGVTAFWP